MGAFRHGAIDAVGYGAPVNPSATHMRASGTKMTVGPLSSLLKMTAGTFLFHGGKAARSELNGQSQ
jgi:hypothetical protein